MKSLALAAALLALTSAGASAACRVPSGDYAGSGNGVIYTTLNVFVSTVSSVATLKIKSGGMWKISGTALTKLGVEEFNYTVPRIGSPNNTFDRTECRGVATDSRGVVLHYSVSNEGFIINITGDFPDYQSSVVTTYRRM
jgi:hypothetical protein